MAFSFGKLVGVAGWDRLLLVLVMLLMLLMVMLFLLNLNLGDLNRGSILVNLDTLGKRQGGNYWN